MHLSPLWIELGEIFMNENRVLIADVDCVQSKNICETEKVIIFGISFGDKPFFLFSNPRPTAGQKNKKEKP